ncbi:hypothetical protein B0A53_06468 [Rhodotorula sp. CCFEE 5036]|nr:hypothetical protein B0A53_06468 [Rhodotorula sp. CCFEE 5036]
MAEQVEKSFQKQPLFHNAKVATTSRKVAGKDRRWYKEVGLGFKTPREAIEGTYIDKKCPFTGLVSIRGRILTGKVVSTKMNRTIIIRREYLHFVPKYSRYEKRHKNVAVHCSPAFRVEVGDNVTVGHSDSAALDTSDAGKVPSAPADRVLPDGDAGHRTDVDGEAHVAVDITASATDTANVALRRMAGLRAAINLPEARPEQDAQQVELAVARSPDQRTLGSRVPESGGHPDALRARDELSEEDDLEDADLSDRDWSTEAESEPEAWDTEPETESDESVDLSRPFGVLNMNSARRLPALTGPPPGQEESPPPSSDPESPPSGSPPGELPPPEKRCKT